MVLNLTLTRDNQQEQVVLSPVTQSQSLDLVAARKERKYRHSAHLHVIMLGVCSQLVCSGLCPLRAEDAQSLTLAAAIGNALTNNPSLLSARERVEAASGSAFQRRLWDNPNLEFSSGEFPPSGGGFSAAQNLVGLSQAVPFPGKKALDAKIGDQEISAAQWEYRIREIGLVRQVKVAFYRVLASEKKAAVLEQLVGLARSLADATAKRVEAGATTKQEQLRAEIEMERENAELAAVRRELAEARESLVTLMGRSREPLGVLQGELPENVPTLVVEEAREQVLAEHPLVHVALANRERAELELRNAKLDPLPDLTLGVAGGRDEGADETLMEFRVSAPLPLFDRAQGRKREARALAEVAKCDLAATKQFLVQELALVQARLQAAREQVDAYRTRILPKADEALRLARGGFDAGKFGFLDFLDTQRTSAAARLAYYDKLLDLNIAQSELEALLLKDQHSLPPSEKSNSKSQT